MNPMSPDSPLNVMLDGLLGDQKAINAKLLKIVRANPAMKQVLRREFAHLDKATFERILSGEMQDKDIPAALGEPIRQN